MLCLPVRVRTTDSRGRTAPTLPGGRRARANSAGRVRRSRRCRLMRTGFARNSRLTTGWPVRTGTRASLRPKRRRPRTARRVDGRIDSTSYATGVWSRGTMKSLTANDHYRCIAEPISPRVAPVDQKPTPTSEYATTAIAPASTGRGLLPMTSHRRSFFARLEIGDRATDPGRREFSSPDRQGRTRVDFCASGPYERS